MSTSPSAPELSIISEMITPALFLLASGSLIATVLARVGRIVESVRKVAELAKHSGTGLNPNDRELLATLSRRGFLAEKALIAYYAAVFLFVLTCFLIGIDHLLGHIIRNAPIWSAMIGVFLVLLGTGFMVAECRIAMRQLHSELVAIR